MDLTNDPAECRTRSAIKNRFNRWLHRPIAKFTLSERDTILSDSSQIVFNTKVPIQFEVPPDNFEHMCNWGPNNLRMLIEHTPHQVRARAFGCQEQNRRVVHGLRISRTVRL